jgi:hypothetical protein
MCRRAGKGLLQQLYKRHKGKCHYCNVEVVCHKSVAGVFLYQKKDIIYYQIDDTLYQAHIATVDHIKDIEFGGDNHHENVVLSCHKCNQKKQKLKCKYYDSPEMYEWAIQNLMKGI